MRNSVWTTRYAKDCVSKWGEYRLRRIQFDDIGYIEFCEICGTGEWVRMLERPMIPIKRESDGAIVRNVEKE